MLLSSSTKQSIQFISCVTHEGKVVLFGIAPDEKIYYTVKQDGYEDTHNSSGWENWKILEFPSENDDESVKEKEKKELTYQEEAERFILQSLYKTDDRSAAAPVQLVSALGHIYVFRQSTTNTLLVDRFVLDGMTNTLNRKYEVRYQQSRKKYEPLKNTQNNQGIGLSSFDSLNFQDKAGKFFYEPTKEISIVQNLHNGWFSVVLLPTNELDKYRWHIFAYNGSSKKVESISIRASEEGLFDVKDATVFDPKPGEPSVLVARSIPGIIRRSFELENEQGRSLQIANGLSATKYDVQSEVLTQDGELQLIKDATKVMLVIPTDDGNTVALSFAAAKDGTLSQISETPDLEILRSINRAVLLPLNTLDNVRAIGDSTPPAGGMIASMNRTEGDRVQIISAEAASLKSGDNVKIQGTTHYNGYYLAQKIDNNTFEITAKWVDSDSKNWQLGTWEEVPTKESGLIFDGIITAAERTADGKLRITSPNHGLESRDGVQISDTQGMNGTYPVVKVDGNGFVLDMPWQPGAAANVKLEFRKRRGISFDGGDYIETPALLELKPPSPEYDFGETYSAWIQVPSNMVGEQLVVAEKGQLMQLILKDRKVVLNVQCSDGFHQIEDPDPVTTNQWVHYAGSFSCIHTKSDSQKTTETTLVLCRNGQQIAMKVISAMPETTETKPQDLDSDGNNSRKQQRWLPKFLIGGTETANHITGKIADVQVWNKAREPREILDSMYLRLTGKEVGLVGYWRLGAIAEGDQREVADFSVFGNNGIVYGDPFVSAVTLDRTLQDGVTHVVKYTNDDLVAVTQRATYEESFEFKLDKTLDPNSVDEKGNKIFEFSYWGKANRDSEKRESFTGVMETFQLKNGWHQASTRFTVPDGVKLIRCFELSNVSGDWKTLEIRKHRVQLVSDAITEARYNDEVKLPTLNDQQAEHREIFERLARYEQEEASLLLRKWELEQATKPEFKGNLERTVQLLRNEVATLKATYDVAVDNSENYWCKIISKHSGKVIDVAEAKTNDGAKVHQWDWVNKDNQKWMFKPTGEPRYYEIVCKHAPGKALDVNGASKSNGGNISLWPSSHVDNQKWRRELADSSSTTYRIIAKHSGKVLDVSGVSKDNGVSIQQWDWADTDSRKWKIEALLNEPCNNKIHDANKALQDKRTALEGEESRLRDINNAENRLRIANTRLASVQHEIATLASGQSGSQPIPVAMTLLKTDTRKLKTQGGLLSFVCPASRIAAIETCEGNVQLSYFDDQGKMRRTNFDATADSRNAAFEQWIPDQLAVCLKFSGSSALNCGGNIDLKKRSFTIEFWAKRDQLSQEAYVLSQGQELKNQCLRIGFRGDGTFTFGFSSNDLNTEKPYDDFEWHHWSCVYDQQSQTRKIYQDGEPIATQENVAEGYQGSGDLILGQHIDGKHPLVGRLAEVRIWDIALTTEEVEINSKLRLSGNEPGLLAYYPLHEQDVVRDLTGQQKNATIQGTVSWCRSAIPIGQLKRSVLKLDGVDDYLSLLEMAHDFSKGFTVEAWVCYDSFNSWSRIIDFGNGVRSDNIVFANDGVSNNLTYVVYVGESSQRITASNVLEVGQWTHLVATVDGSGNAKLYKNGKEIQAGQVSLPSTLTRANNYIGKSNWSQDGYFDGKISDVRLWNKTRTEEEIQADMHRRLTGKEEGLVSYWLLEEIQGDKVSDLKSANDGTINGAVTIQDTLLPIGGDTLISCEYSTIGVDADQKKSAIMRRFFASPSTAGVNLLAGQRIEELERVWVGNAQVKPTLLGYIEGAPPVPSENLTLLTSGTAAFRSYNDASSVELVTNESVSYSWNRSQDAGLGGTFSFFGGVGWNALNSKGKFGGTLDSTSKYSFLNTSNISASSGLQVANRLNLHGSVEQQARFSHLGKRFIPKNIGYALVVSGLADMYVVRLSRSKKMVAYQLEPNEDIPLDVNTITFLINPAYTMNGTLDGLTGSKTTSERFFQLVPEMRAQYGSLYPASYFRLLEAYALKKQISYRDQYRKSYFKNFNARLVHETSLDTLKEAENSKYNTGAPVVGKENEDAKSDDGSTTNDNTDAVANELVKSEEVKKEEKKKEIASRFKQVSQQVHATECFSGWQKKMENIQLLASKRNIVNTYVWDADGGNYAESQQFASVIEHTIGGSYSFTGAIGGQFEEGTTLLIGHSLSVKGQLTAHMTQTMTKKESRSKGFALNVSVAGVERQGVTDYRDRPLLPGEKVDRYRFMSFYLEGSTNNFNDFFAYVVDPEWLASNDEEARALRQVNTSSPNKTWRVLHRVTYVERPTLMG